MNIIKCLFFVVVVLSATQPSSAIMPFDYYNIKVTEPEPNHFILTFDSKSGLNSGNIMLRIQDKNINPDFSNNIVLYNPSRYSNTYTYHGYLKDYSVRKNKVFNPWFNASWTKKTTYNITEGIKDYPLNITTSFNKSDRWINESDQQPVNFWNETNNLIWVKLPANGDYQISKYVNETNYYDSISDGENVFYMFDDFNGGSLNTTKWEGTTGAAVVSNGILTYTGVGDQWINTYLNYASNQILKSRSLSPASSWSLHGLQKDPYTSPYQRVSFYRDVSNTYVMTADTAGSADIVTNFTAGSYSTKEIYWLDSLNYLMWFNNGIQSLNSPYTTGDFIPDESLAVAIRSASVSINIDWILLRPYVTNPPTYSIYRNDTYIPMTITSYGNNYTNDMNITLNIYNPEYINFNITTNITSDFYAWFIDDIDQGHIYDNFSYNFSDNTTVNVHAYNTTYSSLDEIDWYVYLLPPTPTPTPTATFYLNQSQYDELVARSDLNLMLAVFAIVFVLIMLKKNKRG